MLERFRRGIQGYSRSFWLIFAGMLINAIGGSMVWPFMTIFMRQRLEVPLTTVALLLTINSVAGLAMLSVAGPAVDRFGRRIAMVASLLMGALTMVGLNAVATFGLAAILMVINGGFSPLLRVGANAMIADLVEPERRARAYALVRMAANFGVAIGPAVGGFVTGISYAFAFYCAAGVQLLVGFLLLFFLQESVPARQEGQSASGRAGYAVLLGDRPFLYFCAIYTLAGLAYSMLMILLPVYVKENFGVRESQYGFIMATNAAMVVVFQFAVTRVTERFRPWGVLAVGALFYALGTGSVAWGSNFWAFLLSMVVLTVGEMIMIPTSTTLTASLAPVDMRGRYMAIYHLTWGLAVGIGPVLGGLLNDHIAPVAIWYGAMLAGLLSALGFLLLRGYARRKDMGGKAKDGAA
jgi:MFS family permease